MHVTTIGAGRPVVIIHGWRLDSTVEQADLEPVFAVSPGWRRHYVDLPGMGQSEPLGPGATLSDYVVALRATIEGLVGSGPYAIAGTSAGALLALVAASADEGAAALMLRMPLVEPDVARRRVPTGADANLSPHAAEHRAEKIRRLWAPAESRAHPAAVDLRNDPLRYNLDVPTVRLTVPSLVLAGRQDTRVGWRDAARLLDPLPHATFCVIDDAEHEYPWASEPVFVTLVKDWLTRASAKID